MKVLKSIIPILIFIVFANYGYAQFPIQDSTIVYDGEGNPFYLRNQMIVKFHPDLVDTSKIKLYIHKNTTPQIHCGVSL